MRLPGKTRQRASFEDLPLYIDNRPPPDVPDSWLQRGFLSDGSSDVRDQRIPR